MSAPPHKVLANRGIVLTVQQKKTQNLYLHINRIKEADMGLNDLTKGLLLGSDLKHTTSSEVELS